MIPESEARQTYDELLVFSGLDPAEVDQLRDWYCYTKPVGPEYQSHGPFRLPGPWVRPCRSRQRAGGSAESDMCPERSGENDNLPVNAILR